MRVAYLLNQYPMPSQTFIHREIAALEHAGWSVDRYSLRPPEDELVDPDLREERERTRTVLGPGGAARLLVGTIATFCRQPGTFVRTLGTALRLGRGSSRGVRVHLVYLAEACVLRRWLDEADSTHVHCHFGTNAPLVALLVRRLGGPRFSFTVHGPEEFDDPHGLRLGAKIAEAAFVVAISSFGRSQLMRWAAEQDWSKIQVVRCGLDRRFIDEAPQPAQDTSRVLCIGRLSEQKGQLLLVEAVGALLAEGTPIELVLAGEGPFRPLIEAAVERVGAQDAVQITGWIDTDRVRDELRRARVLVMPSFAEGLPVAIMEALATGRPVVTTSIAGIPELVDDRCGWLVPAGSVDALTAALREALRTPAPTLDAMGLEGRRRVLERHDAAREAAALAALFERADQDLEDSSRSQVDAPAPERT